MIKLALVFGAGLIVGWNFLPQPQAIKELIDKIKNSLANILPKK